jgi:hypothetical protein
MPASDGPFTLNLGPRGRGAPDSLRDLLSELTSAPSHFRIASQQLSDREFITGLVEASAGLRGDTQVFVERRYLYESSPLPADQIWQQGGKNEANREALLALLRGGVDVTADIVSTLQHANFILTLPDHADSVPRVLLTSANLTQNSVDRHLNWSLLIDDSALVPIIEDLFDTVVDGDFTDTAANLELDGGRAAFRVGSNGEVLEDIAQLIDGATESIDFAYFNISDSSPILPLFLAAAERGIRITGVVDGDQGYQSWNPLPTMQEAGIDARYYPGQMTGAPGRMHHKTMLIDGETLHFGTANLSRAAGRSLELGVTIRTRPALSAYAKSEIERLHARARRTPPPLTI